jgi:hypothetical protein|tara:strand:+ start:206 stop:421 length:216 start_codon:yes stop_codon:yes gene_type:complete
MDKEVKNLIISYLEWAKEQPPNHYEIETDDCKIVIDGIEMNIPTEQDLVASFEEEAAKLEVTVDYYMEEFL